MFVRVKKSPSKLTAVQLVEGMRDPLSGKVKQKVIRHIGSAKDDGEIKKLVELGEFIKLEIEGKVQPSLLPAETMATMVLASRKQEEELPGRVKRTNNQGLGKADNDTLGKDDTHFAIDDVRKLRQEGCVVTGIHTIYGKIFDSIGFNKVLYNSARQVYASGIIKNIVLARIANPKSKRESVRFLEEQYGVNLKLDSVYAAMNKIDDRSINKIQDLALSAASGLFKETIDVLFYDATTLYFESFTTDELKQKGYSKDNKWSEVQVILSIFVTKSGIPIGYEVFPGATYEGHTLLTALGNLRKRFAINNVVFVADSGMLNEDNLSLLEAAGYNYIVGARVKNMNKKVTEQILNKTQYRDLTFNNDDKYQGKIIPLENKGESEAKESHRILIVSHSEQRARKDAHERDESIKKLMKKLKKSKDAKSMISNSGYKKYLTLDGKSELKVAETRIIEDSKWDGLHGVITNIKNPSITDILSQYKGLWQVEETFRISKHDIKVRPIYHWTQDRIKAHIALCFMALVCIRHLEYRVNLQKTKMSAERIRRSLTSVNITLVRHIEDKRRFAIPSSVSDDAKIIYKTMDLKLSNTPYLV